MSFFQRKRKTVVSTSIVRVIEDDVLDNLNPFTNTLIASAIKGTNISTGIINSSLDNSTYRFERAYTYGSRDYVFGLPDTELLTNNSADILPIIQPIIDGEAGQPTTIEYIEFATLNGTHVAWNWLVNQGYDNATNEIVGLSNTIGFPCFLDSIIRIYPENIEGETFSPAAWIEWEPPSTNRGTPEHPNHLRDLLGHDTEVAHATHSSGAVEGVQIFYTYQDADNVFHQNNFFIDLSSFDFDADYYHVKYSYTVSGETILHYWFYQAGAGNYPPLDNIYGVPTYQNPGTYFPFLPFRKSHKNMVDTYDGQPELDSLRKMASLYGIDFDELTTQISDNPDIDDIRTAALIMGVPINTQNPIAIKYLHKFFSRTLNTQPALEDLISLSGNRGSEHTGDILRALNIPQNLYVYELPPTRYALRFYDAGLGMNLSYGGLARNIVQRSGTPGSFTSEVITITYTVRQSNPSSDDTEYVDVPVDVYVVAFRQQINSSLCDEILLFNPEMVYDVRGRYKTDADALSDNLIIPLDRSICKEFPMLERYDLYHRGMHLVFNASVTYKQKWYETSFFKLVLVAVSVVVVVFSLGTGSPFVAGLTAALSAGALATAIFLLEIIIGAILTRYVFRLVANELGIEAAIVLSVILAAVSLGISGTESFNAQNMWATKLLQLSNGLMIGVGAALENEFTELEQEFVLLEAEKEESYSQLEAAQNLLTNEDSLLDPLLTLERIEPLTLFGESPQDYFNRTAHSGNIGTVAFDFIENYVDISLTLPTIEQTIGGLT